MDIYIIAHLGPEGRIIDGAALQEEEARELAEEITDNFLMEGYPAPEIQRTPYAERLEAEKRGEPALLAVYLLRKSRREGEAPAWKNVEIYRFRK